MANLVSNDSNVVFDICSHAGNSTIIGVTTTWMESDLIDVKGANILDLYCEWIDGAATAFDLRINYCPEPAAETPVYYQETTTIETTPMTIAHKARIRRITKAASATAALQTHVRIYPLVAEALRIDVRAVGGQATTLNVTGIKAHI